MKNLIIKIALASSFLLPIGVLPNIARASGTRSISTSDARGINGKTMQLLIHPGYDLTIDFLGLNEIIVDATLADPSNFTFNGLVGNLCPKFAPTQCEGNGSRLIRIRQIKPINFEHITKSADGSTTLTLVTQGAQGLKVYKFILKKGHGKPSFDHISVTPDPEKLPLKVSQEELDKARERWQEGNKNNCKPRKIRVALYEVVEENTKQCQSI